ncbi:MAG: hypothetical protein LQ348_002677 [Seirophora lacunosa]|nr:MAG: hypothetical protein LQ348_002677 [Seirophora lacunosa]
MAASNASTAFSPSSSPSCHLSPQEPLLPWISDNVLAIILPTLVYAVAGGFFHLLDTYELFGNYRIHPTEDELKRNHITRWECLKGVVRYHVIQISIGLLLNHGASPPMVRDEACRIHHAANMVHNARHVIPIILNTIGIDAKQLSHAAQGTSPTLASIIGGGDDLTSIITSPHQPAQNHLTPFDFALATFSTNILVPALQYLVALIVVDTWIYFTHRLCHVNRTLYRLVHAQHHRLYVSYAYGAVYAHWLETLFLDILSFVLAGEIARLSPRQSMLFASAATVKTISDHCGYIFPWDPLRFLNANGARFHDLHHQTWGLKYNFSTYTVFWDNLLGTTWADQAGAEKRYERVWALTGGKRGQEEQPGVEKGGSAEEVY